MYKVTYVRILISCFSLVILSIFVACSSVEPENIASMTPTSNAVNTRQISIHTENPSTVSTPTSTITPTPELTLNPTSTSTVLSLATTVPPPTSIDSPLRKVGVMPISGFNVVVSKNGGLIAVDNEETDTIYIYDINEQSVIWELLGDGTGMTGYSSLDFTPSGNLLAAGGVRKDVFVWDMNDGELVYTISEPYDEVKKVSFSSDGQLLAVTSEETYSADAGVMIYSMLSGELVDKFPSPNIKEYPTTSQGEHFLSEFHDFGWFMGEAVFVPNQSTLLAFTINDPETLAEAEPWALYFWDMETQQLQEVLMGTFGSEIAISPNGQFLIADIDNHLHGWDILNQTNFLLLSTKNLGRTIHISLTNDGLIARLNSDGMMTLWDKNGDIIFSSEPDIYITDFSFMSNGDLLVARLEGTNDAVLEIWEIVE